MCDSCSQCFSDEEKKQLEEKGWNKEQIDFVEGSIVKDKVKEFIEDEKDK